MVKEGKRKTARKERILFIRRRSRSQIPRRESESSRLGEQPNYREREREREKGGGGREDKNYCKE